MVSNFLGDVGSVPQQNSSIISTNELMAREGVDLRKGMNFRDKGEQLSVFLVLQRGDSFKDEWNEKTGIYTYEGHDSTTVESGKSVDQLLMYGSGKLTDNGHFYKAAHAFKDGIRKEPLQVQIYEKLDPGVWYDKGIFNLEDAKQVQENGRKVCKFYLTLADAEFYRADDPDRVERLIPAAMKADVWARDGGRCAVCQTERGLCFSTLHDGSKSLRCGKHGGRATGGLLG